ncbi:MAG: heme exporter protein CcmB [Devosia sp. 67-54]|uniref:heme exporter protein CcmB n=1 Tax=unclassified Devosia TaxID=196773 RepID=UPI000958EF99|nr:MULTISPECIES: heme exporter protein CcmB [unclassified Devosia]MBN9307055.1 heme exporter protein CcmB [Devosia sp.]OJX19468.1 MAG: heme exporter protein CcmB [Devosia sp. 67-54]
MSAFAALLVRDLRLAGRGGADALTLVLFFVMVGAVTPFAVGPDRVLLARLAPGIVWIAAFLSLLLGLDRLFRADEDDGTLLLLRQAALPLEAVVFAKLLAHWLLTALPLLVASPLLAILLSMDMDVWARTALALLLGTPALAAFGAVGAAVTVGLRRGGLLGPVLMLPLSVPVLIFGAGAIAPGSGDAALLFLAALSLVSVAFCPFAAALALRVGSE